MNPDKIRSFGEMSDAMSRAALGKPDPQAPDPETDAVPDPNAPETGTQPESGTTPPATDAVTEPDGPLPDNTGTTPPEPPDTVEPAMPSGTSRKEHLRNAWASVRSALSLRRAQQQPRPGPTPTTDAGKASWYSWIFGLFRKKKEPEKKEPEKKEPVPVTRKKKPKPPRKLGELEPLTLYLDGKLPPREELFK